MKAPQATPKERQGGRSVSPQRRLLALLAAGIVLVTVPQAEAQERRTILDMLFGRRKQPDVIQQTVPAPPPVRRVRPRKTAVTPATTAPALAPITVEKNENARKVLVVGDFLANGLGDGLTEAFADSPGIAIITRASGSSGLVRDDYHDWLSNLPALLNEIKPDAVIVQIGANDRQQMLKGAGRGKFGGDEWTSEYIRRVGALAQAVTSRKIPLLWVGLVPFPSAGMSSDILTINRLLRGEAEKAGGQFIDVWDGFADEDGAFVVTGSDINGVPARLRNTDGIGLAKAGKRKMAFYLEKPLTALFGAATDAGTADVLQTSLRGLPDLVPMPPALSELPVTSRPMKITDPDFDGGTELLGGKAVATATQPPSPRLRLIESGEMAPAPKGRADNVMADSTPR